MDRLKRDVMLTIRLTRAERDQAHRQAKTKNQSLSDYIRTTLQLKENTK